MTPTSPAPASAPVVESPKMPKLTIDSKKAANINAIATSFAIFFGFAVILAAISSFTKKWYVSVPFLGVFLGANNTMMDTLLTSGILVAVAAVISLLTIRKITDVESMKSAWANMAKIFAVVSIIFVVNMIAIALYSLFGLGDKSGVAHGTLWGSNFVANTLYAGVAIAMYFISKQIANGKTKLLGILRFVCLGIAAVALIISIVSILVGFYGKKSSSFTDLDDLYDIYNMFK